MHPPTDPAHEEQLITTMSERMATITRALSAVVQHESPTLADLEVHIVRVLKEVGTALLAGLAALPASSHAVSEVACACGHTARYQRLQPATVTTVLGPITLHRPYYHCATCGRGHHPLDAQLQIAAGSCSAGLDELLALLGATQDSFAEAASVLERLTLVHFSPTTVRDATAHLGAVLVEHQAQQVARMQTSPTLPAPAMPVPARLYVTMDGVLAHLHERGWSEIKVGCCYQTRSRPSPAHPERTQIRAHSPSYVTTLSAALTFGWHLFAEAARRGALDAEEVVVLGDGAHWIWNVADEHFPGATQILDWYHASASLGEAANAI